MAHIRQILANLSISVSEFKKSPKSVIKAARTEPIAVIIDNKPAFYCVPADILESLYQKFYEMNDISLQNIQELNTASDVTDVDDSDDDNNGFGVNDIFQSIEDVQVTKLSSPEDLVDPITTKVADPLDDEVAEQLNSAFDQHLHDSVKKYNNVNLLNEEVHGKVLKGISDQFDSEIDSLSDLKEGDLFRDNLLDRDIERSKYLEKEAALKEALRDVDEEINDKGNDVRKLVSGPDSFSLEHVAKTYSPYQQIKVKSKRVKKSENELECENEGSKGKEEKENPSSRDLGCIDKTALAEQAKATRAKALSGIQDFSKIRQECGCKKALGENETIVMPCNKEESKEIDYSCGGKLDIDSLTKPKKKIGKKDKKKKDGKSCKKSKKEDKAIKTIKG